MEALETVSHRFSHYAFKGSFFIMSLSQCLRVYIALIMPLFENTQSYFRIIHKFFDCPRMDWIYCHSHMASEGEI